MFTAIENNFIRTNFSIEMPLIRALKHLLLSGSSPDDFDHNI
jgi:hypothetical protein